ncbi:Ktr system potassium transporter B [Photobacterium angustum]|uniref:Ktr system potassium transporter B n=2 Tax=Photobacterium angustum TaxID=661 RepID=A0A855SGH1_PHOAN|nr:Ktr system potassium transporter B [Photobacterium damselae subsp. damselae]KJG08170.1 Ktr system potassium transporter B [Photobacterium angustum]KJG17877.1 Ktr system potassium transporter B [Photobacterium angustum]KJG24533.1 Ktr system potassium transporter B [Photobacterium angustum]KJG32029.1 Ktr system potassium transporter B [Photobacterium angustum]
MSFIPNRGMYVPIKTDNHKKRWSEPQIIIFSFLAILIPAAILLTLPAFSVSGLSFADALFTATSAISVTGLGVVDTGSHFSTSGKVLLMLLMQIGGLGQMTLSAVLLYMFGLRLSLRQQALTKEQLGQDKFTNIRRLVKHIIIFVLICELIGIFFLSLRWVPQMGWEQGLFFAVFHSISAFNNAGFSLFSDGLTRYVDDPLVIITISSLFILGGLGFTVISDIKRNAHRGFHFLSLHSKIMIIATPILLFAGTVIIWLLEHHNSHTLGPLNESGQWLAAFFQSATARTAGFNSVDIGKFTEPTMLVMMLLMLIGAGSTSTGGGIKVSTFVVAILATWSFLKQRDRVVLFKRTISNQTVTKSLAIIVVSGIVLTIAMFALMITEKAPFYEVMFETISAFATVGVTAGLTATLSEPGKYIMIVVMIIGRLGPLTLAYMLARPKPTLLRYPEDNVAAG